jgi:hypothetical protein
LSEGVGELPAKPVIVLCEFTIAVMGDFQSLQ